MATNQPLNGDTDNMLLRKIAKILIGGLSTSGGRTGSYTEIVRVTPTVSANVAYTAGDAVGGAQNPEFSRVAPDTGTPSYGADLESITITDLSNQKPALTLVFLGRKVSETEVTDNEAFAFDVADVPHVIATVSIAAADWATIGSRAIVTKSGVGIVLDKELGGQHVGFEVIVVTSGTPTFLTTDALTFSYGVIQD